MSYNNQKTDTLKSRIEVEISSALGNLYPDERINPDLIGVDLTPPKEENHGDYSSTLCLKISKILGEQPIEIAKKIKGELEKDEAKLKNLGVVKIDIQPPGFINFWLTREFLGSQLNQVLDKGDKFGENFVNPKSWEKFLKKQSKNIKLDHPTSPDSVGIRGASPTSTKHPGENPHLRIMVEFCHPNTHKEFHIGHLRNIILAESLIRLFENLGVEVVRVNYQGDVGMHIAKCLYNILQSQKSETIYEKVKYLGQMYAVGNKAYEEDENAKKEIIKINRKIYEKDPQIMPLWNQTRQWSLDYFEEMYKRAGSHYDRYYFESEVYEPGKKIVLEHLQDEIFEKSEGAIIFPGEKYGLHNRVFITGEGFPTYEAKDMGLGVLQFNEYNPDLIIHVVGPEQAGYFQVVFEALSRIFPKSKGKELHFIYGWVQLKEGKMSSRKGNVVTGRWLLDEAKKKARSLITKKDYSEKETEEITEKVALSAAKYAMLKFAARSDISFDFNESVSLEGDSGPYLLYTYARTRSVLRKSQIPNSKFQINLKFQIPNSKFNEEEMALLRTIYRFPEVAYEAGVGFAPNLICSYLFDLAQKFNLFYQKHSILNPANTFRIALTSATGQIIKNSLCLLGIETVERM